MSVSGETTLKEGTAGVGESKRGSSGGNDDISSTAVDGGVRITSWNVNGIRNPFSYQPWIDLKTYAAMFETLEADIICFQELKIQKRELTDAMVLVPGWDCFFTVPKYKKGYSGVAIYTRQSKVSPIKAEEGITGYLTGPNSTTQYIDLPSAQQIGGYPASLSREQALNLDSEGRAVILDFGAFVLIGTYSPANRDSSRDEFRTEFVRTLFERCRNLITAGRRVVLTGDLNIARDEMDSAHAKEAMVRSGVMDFKELSECRMMFDRLLEPCSGGVMADLCREWWKDRRGMYTCWEQRIQARPGNYGARIDYVCCSSDMKSWFSEANIQEGLMGSDHCPVYAVLKPVVGIHDTSTGKITETHLLDIINPPGMFVHGIEQPSFRTSKSYQVPKLSGRLMPEFAARRSIKDMFTKKGNIPKAGDDGGGISTLSTQKLVQSGNLQNLAQLGDSESQKNLAQLGDVGSQGASTLSTQNLIQSGNITQASESQTPSRTHPPGDIEKTFAGAPAFNSMVTESSGVKLQQQVQAISANRSSGNPTKRTLASTLELPTDAIDKRRKRGAGLASSLPPGAGQQKQSRLSGFFKPKSHIEEKGNDGFQVQKSGGVDDSESAAETDSNVTSSIGESDLQMKKMKTPDDGLGASNAGPSTPTANGRDGGTRVANAIVDSDQVHDPVATKETWDKLFTPKPPPLCEGHGEPAKRLVTKKKGGNCGRAFWVCARPVGPNGEQKGSSASALVATSGGEWRCNFFMWCSEWSG